MKLSTLFTIAAAILFISATAAAQYDITIGRGASNSGSWSGGDPDVWTGNGTFDYAHKVNVEEINTRLNAGTSVVIYSPNGSIIDSAGVSISKTAGGDATLTLRATGYLSFAANDTIISTSGKLNIIFNGDYDNNMDGYITMQSGTGRYFSTNNGDIVIGGGSDPLNNPIYGPSYTYPLYISETKFYAGTGNISVRAQSHPTAVSDAVQFYTNSVMQTTTGNITIVGTGGDKASGFGSAGFGMRMGSNPVIQTTDGAISITATGGNAPEGNGGYGLTISQGAAITASGTGSITIVGTGGSSYYNGGYGVNMSGQSVTDPYITTVDGDITITATSGPGVAGGTGSSYYGLRTIESLISASGTGDIVLIGTGGSGTSNNTGMYLSDTPVQTNSGSITVTAVGGAGTTGGSGGSFFYASGASSGLISTSGTISVTSTANKGGAGLYVQGGNTRIESGGNVTIVADTTGSGYGGYGIQTAFGGDIRTTGTGNLTITAIGSKTGSGSKGIYLGGGGESRVETQEGNLTVNAFGGGSSGSDDYGIDITNSNLFYSSDGDVTINATAGYAGAGISFSGTGYFQADSGKLKITATGLGQYGYGVIKGSSGYTGHFVSLGNDSLIVTMNGAQTYNGFYTFGPFNFGNAAFSGPMVISASTASGSDAIDLGSSGYQATITGTGHLTMQGATAATTMGIAGGSGTFNVSADEMNAIQTGFRKVTFGRSDGSGAININAYTSNDSLELVTGSGAININGALNVGVNSLDINSGGTVTQSGVITADVLTLSGTGTHNLNAQNNVIGTFNASADNAKLRDDAGITVGSLTSLDATLTTNTNFSESSEFSVTRLTLAGSAVFSLSDTVQKLTLSGTASLTLTGEFSADTLVMNGGNIDATSYTLSLGTGTASVSHAARTSGTVLGSVKRWFGGSAVTNALFPIGTASNYRPATMSFTSATATPGSITAQFSTTAPGDNGLPLTDTDDGEVTAMLTNGYWILNEGDGLTGGTYDLDLNADGFSGVTYYQDVKILKRENDSSPWTLDGTAAFGTGSNSSPVAHRMGYGATSEFGVAQSAIPVPIFTGTPSSIAFGVKPVNTSTVDSVKVKNTGTLVMNVTSVVSDSASFVISQGDTTIAIGDSVMYYVAFAPTTTGSKSGTLKFYHDAVGSPSSVTLTGTSIESEPTTQTSVMSFTGVDDNSMIVHWTNGNGANRIVLARSGSAVNSSPSDASSYTANAAYGSGSQVGSGNYVVYSGTGDSIEVTGLGMSTTYHFAVMEFNGSSGAENYLTVSPLTGSQSTLGPQYDTTAGYALALDGSSQYVDLGNPGGLQIYTSTIEAWIKTSDAGVDHRGILVKPNAYSLFLFNNQLCMYDWYYGQNIVVGSAINDNAWHHVAATLNGPNGNFEIYLDGVLVSNTSMSGYYVYNYYNYNQGNAAAIGSGGGAYQYFNGQIEEVKLWNVIRTQAQIREDMHRTPSGVPSGLLSTWQFKDGSGSIAYDILGGRNGTLINSPSWVASTAPVGQGTSTTNSSFSSGTTALGTVSVTTSEDFDNAVALVSTAISVSPYAPPTGSSINFNDRYWNLKAYGTPGSFSANLTFTVPDSFTNNGTASASNYTLYRRNSNEFGSWTVAATGASVTTNTITFNGITSFSQFAIGTDDALPVELSSFAASVKQNVVELKWSTATELNNHGFAVERMENGKTDAGWKQIGFVEGNGTSNAPKEYSYADKIRTTGTYSYRLKLMDRDGSFGYSPTVETEAKFVPTVYALEQNFPNPFNPATTIVYQLPKNGRVSLKVYDVLGKEVMTLVDELKEAGAYEVKFGGQNLASGLYFYRIQAGDFVSVKKMVMVK